MALEYVKQDDPNVIVSITDTPVLVDFTSTNCAPCMMMAPEVEAFAAEHEDIRVFSINADYCPAIAAHFRVRLFPMMHLVYNGQSIAVTAGFLDKTAIEAFVQNALANI